MRLEVCLAGHTCAATPDSLTPCHCPAQVRALPSFDRAGRRHQSFYCRGDGAQLAAFLSQPLKLLPEAVEGAEPAIFIPGSWQTAPQQESGDRSEEMLAQVAEAAATLSSGDSKSAQQLLQQMLAGAADAHERAMYLLAMRDANRKRSNDAFVARRERRAAYLAKEVARQRSACSAEATEHAANLAALEALQGEACEWLRMIEGCDEGDQTEGGTGDIFEATARRLSSAARDSLVEAGEAEAAGDDPDYESGPRESQRTWLDTQAAEAYDAQEPEPCEPEADMIVRGPRVITLHAVRPKRYSFSRRPARITAEARDVIVRI